MCGFVGFCNLNKKTSDEVHILNNMTKTLAKRGPDEEDFFVDNHIAFGHRRLIILDAENGRQPMSAKIRRYNLYYCI